MSLYDLATAAVKMAEAEPDLFEILGQTGASTTDVKPKPTEVGRDRTESAHLPSYDHQQNWRYAMMDHGGRKALHILANGRTYRWHAADDQMKDIVADRPVELTRGGDAVESDFAMGGKSLGGGALQVHHSDPERLYATMQDGRRNMTFDLQRMKGDKWMLTPRLPKPKPHPAHAFMDAVVPQEEKIASADVVICKGCRKFFNHSKQPETSMGTVKCPHCKASVDQEGKLLKEGSAYVRDVTFKDLPKDTQADIERFSHGGTKGVLYGMVIKELLHKCDQHNLATARKNVADLAEKKAGDEVRKRQADKFILLVNDRVVDGHHFIAKAEKGKITNSLNVIDLTPTRFQRKVAELLKEGRRKFDRDKNVQNLLDACEVKERGENVSADHKFEALAKRAVLELTPPGAVFFPLIGMPGHRPESIAAGAGLGAVAGAGYGLWRKLKHSVLGNPEGEDDSIGQAALTGAVAGGGISGMGNLADSMAPHTPPTA